MRTRKIEERYYCSRHSPSKNKSIPHTKTTMAAVVVAVLLWTVIALTEVAAVAAFIPPPTERVECQQRFALSNYGTSVRTGEDDYVDINRGGSGGPIVRSRGPNNIMPISNARAPSLAEIWDSTAPVVVQGGSLRTWHYSNPAVDALQILLKSEGRPIDCDVDLWNGPNNTPHKMRVYVEDGDLRTFNAIVGTPRGPNSVAIRNIGQLEFPVDAVVRPDMQDGLAASIASVVSRSEVIQGGAIRTWPFNPIVQSVAVILKTDGRPLNARIELLQGPNNNKQVVELYTEDGLERPFFAIIETPEAAGSVIRIVNSAPLEFPLYASVDAYTVGDYYIDSYIDQDRWPML